MNLSSDYNSEIINLYLSGQLQGAELQQFINRIQTDASFRQEVELQQMLIGSIHHAGKIKLRERLDEIHHQLNTKDSIAPRSAYSAPAPAGHTMAWRYTLGIAASLAIIIAVTYYIFYNNTNPDNTLFTAYFSPYTNVVYTIYRDPAQPKTDDKLKLAFEAYDQQDYQTASTQFEKLKADNLNPSEIKQEDEVILFYLGNTYLAMGETSKAIDIFTRYSFDKFNTEARWYLSLSYIKEGRVAEAKLILEKLAADDNDFSAKATEILMALKE
jgi:tetratricopeptide (TPR) repeat protein